MSVPDFEIEWDCEDIAGGDEIMYQDCGTWSTQSTLPLQGWTKKTTVQLGDFESWSTSPPSDAMCAIVDTKKRPDTTYPLILYVASEGGLVDQGSHIPMQSCENLSPPLRWEGGLGGPSTRKVIL